MTAPNWINRTIWTGDSLDNLQLLCAACNSLKGDRSQAWLVAELRKRERSH